MRDPWTGQFTDTAVSSIAEAAFMRGVLVGGLAVVFIMLLTAAIILGDRLFAQRITHPHPLPNCKKRVLP